MRFLKRDSVNDIVFENMIKTKYLEKEQIYNGIKLNWRRTTLTPLDKVFTLFFI